MKRGLNFFRETFGIPSEIKLSWCIIEEPLGTPVIYRLGVMLLGHDKVIDVAERRFVQLQSNEVMCGSRAFVAKRRSKGDYFIYEDEYGHQIQKPKSYVHDVYFRCIYTPEMMQTKLI